MLIRISIFSSKDKVLIDLATTMDTIDISQNIQDFKQVFEKEITFRTQMEKHIRILMLQLGIYKQFRMLKRNEGLMKSFYGYN